MSQVSEPTMSVLIVIVVNLPIGTNLGMLHFLWMLVSGKILTNRGAIFHPYKQQASAKKLYDVHGMLFIAECGKLVS